MCKEIRNIFWTGGYDSTYRVLYSLIVDKVDVIAHYLIDSDRKSTGMELLAMDMIRGKAEQWGGVIKGIKSKNINDIERDQDISETYHILKKKYKIGIQYDWLARYAKYCDSEILEISIHGDEKFKKMLGPCLYKEEEKDNWRVKLTELNVDTYKLFKFYDFPIYGIDKKTMRDTAIKNGFHDILEMTWFCHNPFNGAQPCGTCNPCKDAYRMGFSYRLPPRARLRYLYKIEIPEFLRNTLKKW